MLTLRSPSRIIVKNSKQLVRSYASQTSGGGKSRSVKTIVAGSALATSFGVGGAIAYASVDSQFRDELEKTIPGLEFILENMLGRKSIQVEEQQYKTNIINKPNIEVKTSPRPADGEQNEPKKTIQVPFVPPPPPPPLPILKTLKSPPIENDNGLEILSAHQNEDLIETVKLSNNVINEAANVEESEVHNQKVIEFVPEGRSRISKEETVKDDEFSIDSTPNIENTSLEKVLIELCKDMKVIVEEAVKSYQKSSEKTSEHLKIMQEVLESNLTKKDETAWNKMFDAAQAKSDATKVAEIKEKEAVAAIDNVIDMITAGRKNKTTAHNLQLMVAEDCASQAIQLLEETKNKGADLISKVKAMEDYRDIIEDGRKQFHKEMTSLMPDINLGEKGGKLSEDELNMFITHAYKKVLSLQQEVARQQTIEQEKFNKALEKQKIDIQMGQSDKLEQALEKQARDLALEHEIKMKQAKEDTEKEIRSQLRRQAAAHSDHIQDILDVQEAELSRNHDHEQSEVLSNVRSKYLNELAALSGVVNGLTHSLEERYEQDKRVVTAQKLWIACAGFDSSLATMKPLMSEVVTVKAAARSSDEFVNTILSSISPLALDRGVYSMENLCERFVKVEKVARKVASVGEGGSLVRYGLSYLQSMLTVSLETRPSSEPEEPLDTSALSTDELISLAKFSLERENLARAVQYLALLNGEAGRVVSGWLEEARLRLETKQAVDALLAHAVSEGGVSW